MRFLNSISAKYNFIKSVGLISLTILSISSCTSEFYVSPDGNDDNPGTLSNPFYSLHRARDDAREAPGQVTIFLRGGTYYLDSALVLGAEDSGEPGKPVVYTAYNDEKPILSGAIRLELEWSQYQGNIQNASVPPLNPKYPQLFINGNRQILARYPNFDPGVDIFNGYSADALLGIEANLEPHAKKGAFLHSIMSTEWGSLHYQITGIDQKSGAYTLYGGYQVGIPYSLFSDKKGNIPDPEKRFIENVFEELDSPGEWYLDKEEGTIYFFPTGDMDMSSALAEMVMLKQLVVFKGTQNNPVKHIHFRGITFTHTSHVFLDEYEEQLRCDWKINRSGAVFMEGTEDCVIDRCHFDQVGGNAVFMSNYNHRNTVSNCVFDYAGESGICVVGDANSVRSPSTWFNQLDILKDDVDRTSGPRNDSYPSKCTIHNNLMHDLGRIGKQTAGIYIHIAHNITVSHNTIYNLPRAGICIGSGHFGGHIIEFNDIYNTVQETGDHGPFNSWGRDRYWSLEFRSGEYFPVKQYARLDILDTNIIRNNRFHHDGRWGIDLDDGSSCYEIYNNLCLGMGIKLREGFNRTMCNNIIVNWSGDFHVWPDSCSDIITNNIIVNDVSYHFINADPGYASVIDRNLFYNHGNDIIITGLPQGPLKFNEWQALGFDRNSVVADPLFTDPANGDYSVQPASPALKVGFVNFPMDRFGAIGPDWEEGSIVIHKNVKYPGASSPATGRNNTN